MADDPQAPSERRVAARHLLQRPLTCREHDPDAFRLIRRHEAELDRWFTQRLGYRLHVDADTARLYKVGVVPARRPLRTTGGRAFHHGEYVLLALVLASTVAGPDVISLRDLVEQVRSAAAEAEITLVGDATERRSLVAVLRWMIDQGLATELHAHVDAYSADGDADAVLRVRPDRIALLSLPVAGVAATAAELCDEAGRRSSTRQWLRGRLVEEPALYRDDLTDAEWVELRRRLGEEERILDEMFGLVLEVRGEGVAAIDPSGSLADQRFPTGGTVGHAALLLIDQLGPATDDEGASATGPADAVPLAAVVAHVTALAERHATRWSSDLAASPERLTRRVIDLLVDLRLAEPTRLAPTDATDATDATEPGSGTHASTGAMDAIRLLPAAARFRANRQVEDAEPVAPQEALW